MNKPPFYITTTIPYASKMPHIGNVYEIILVDAIARFKRMDGFDVFFLTGTDEHGQKVQKNAIEANLAPQVYVDNIVKNIKNLYAKINISFDNFIRTTDDSHVKFVQSIYEKLLANGDIYLGEYEGFYSESAECFIPSSEINDGKGLNGENLVWTKEKVYFFNLQKYQDRLIKYINEHEDFIVPFTRKNEVLSNFLSEPLPNLSVSRTSFDWGVKLPFDTNHVAYVWLDALPNYLSGLNYTLENKGKLYNAFWPCNLHVLGKDVLRFHAVYWPILLMALDIPLPKRLYVHPWLLFNKDKLSKSTGNVFYTDDLINIFGVDQVRYFVLKEIPYSHDGNISHQLIAERSNSDLTNTIGNLVNRSIAMAHKYRNGVIKEVPITCDFCQNLIEEAILAIDKMRTYINYARVGDAIEEILKIARSANKLIEDIKPWDLIKKGNTNHLDQLLYTLMGTIRIVATLLMPFVPTSAQKIANQLNIRITNFHDVGVFGIINTYKVAKNEPIFNRFNIDDFKGDGK